jgi:hypothetical protein
MKNKIADWPVEKKLEAVRTIQRGLKAEDNHYGRAASDIHAQRGPSKDTVCGHLVPGRRRDCLPALSASFAARRDLTNLAGLAFKRGNEVIEILFGRCIIFFVRTRQKAAYLTKQDKLKRDDATSAPSHV